MLAPYRLTNGGGSTTMSDLPIRALKREERLSDRVAKQLEDLIIEGVLKTGQRMPPERQLAEMFGVSRTVVREAIHNLTAKGLLELRTGSGSYVSGPSTDSVAESLSLLLRSMEGGLLVEDLHDVRRVLETAIAARAAERATDEDILDLEDTVRRMEEAGDDSEAVADLDVEFHRGLAIAAHNPLFTILLDAIGELLLTVRRMALRDPENLYKALYHHRVILEKVKSRDPLQAREAMSEHLGEAEDTMRGVLKTHEDLQSLFRVPKSPSGNAGGSVK